MTPSLRGAIQDVGARLAAAVLTTCCCAQAGAPATPPTPTQWRGPTMHRAPAEWMGTLRAAWVDIGEIERADGQGCFATPEDLVGHLVAVSHGRINAVVLFSWPAYTFHEDRWDIEGAAERRRFDVPRFVSACHARGLKVIAMFTGRHFAVTADGKRLYDPYVDANGRTSSPQGREFTGRLDRPAASFYGRAFEASFDAFCANSARADFDALYLAEYNLPADDLSPSALAYFKLQTGLDVSPAAVGDENEDGRVNVRDSWLYIKRHCLEQWRRTRDARLVQFVAHARDAADAVRPVPFGVLTVFGSVGKGPRLWQSKPLMRRVLGLIDFAGIYCRAFHWRVPVDEVAKAPQMMRQLDPSIPILGELYVGSPTDGIVPLADVIRQARLLAADRVGYYLWLVPVSSERLSYSTLPKADWTAIGPPRRLSLDGSAPGLRP